jgi:thioredoxin-like negative regulator of GroEL
MINLRLTDVDDFINTNARTIVAFVNPKTILSASTLRILKEIETDSVKIGWVDVEDDKGVFSKFTLRIIPTIHVYSNGDLAVKLNLPFSKKDLECLIN